jgi:ATP phosphoribosyltransferase regulatory subunit
MQAGLDQISESTLFDVLQRKARPELEELMSNLAINEDVKAMLLKLPELNGGKEIIKKAHSVLAKADEQVKQALANLEAVAEQLTSRFPALPISFDLAELRGYHYHTGVVFAAFVPTIGREIARGGRYDNIGAVFGRARPATGFSADLKLLALLGKQTAQDELNQHIFAPYQKDNSLNEKIRDLRAQGHIVIQQLPGQIGNAKELGCTAVLELDRQNWVIKALQN